MTACNCLYGIGDPRCCAYRGMERYLQKSAKTRSISEKPWICPRCGTVNAWWVAACRCKPVAEAAA